VQRAKRRAELRRKRHRRVRKRIGGVPDRPRLCVFRSNRHIYAQVVDDLRGQTLVVCSTLSPEIAASPVRSQTVEGAAAVGELVGRKCLEKGISAVVFDRGGRRYHGRVRALAEAARAQFREAGAEGF
jgi:large subunit ribosomal protein L18